MADKEEMIDVFEDMYANLKMEALTNSADVKGNRQLFGQIQGFFLAMRMTVPLDEEELEYVEHRLHSLEEKLL